MIEYAVGSILWSVAFFLLGYVLGYMQRQLKTIETEVEQVEHDIMDIKKKVDDA